MKSVVIISIFDCELAAFFFSFVLSAPVVSYGGTYCEFVITLHLHIPVKRIRTSVHLAVKILH